MSDNQDNERLMGALFRIPFQILNTCIEQGLIAQGFTDIRPAFFEVFRYVRPEGSRSTELAEKAQMTKQSMGYLIDHLESLGYVERLPDPEDRRAKIVRLTEQGRRLEQTARSIIHETEQEWATLLGTERMMQLRQLLEDLIDKLDEP